MPLALRHWLRGRGAADPSLVEPKLSSFPIRERQSIHGESYRSAVWFGYILIWRTEAAIHSIAKFDSVQ